MSTGLLVGIIILLLVVGVPLLQAIIRWAQRRRSLAAAGVPDLRAAGLRSEELPSGLSAQERTAVTSEELAFADDDPQTRIRELDDAGRIIGYREVFRDPRSWGEFADWLLAQSLHRRRAHRRVELELTRYASAEQAETSLNDTPPPQIGEDDIRISDAGERSGVKAREWTRLEAGETVQRMLELRFAAGDVLAIIRGDSEPAGTLSDDEVWRLADAVKGRLR